MPLLRPTATFPVARHVHGFRALMVNYFFVQANEGSREWILVDAGLRSSGPRIRHEAERRFGPRNPPRAIVLTHGHFDHIGALPWLLERWRVPVFAHVAELPHLNDRVPYPAPDPTVGGGLMALGSPFYPRRPNRFRAKVQPLPANGSVPGASEWKWIPTPGHTAGHVSLWCESDRTLLAGDALISTRQESAWAVLRQTPEVRPPPAYFTPDWRSAYASIERLRALRPETLGAGHGLPLAGERLRAGIDRLADDFVHRGLPRQGRYVPDTWAPA